MTPQRWQQVKAALGDALEQDPASRGAYLAAACEGDTSLRREAESLLAQHDAAEAMLDGFAEGPASGLWREPDDPLMGRRIGSYEIIREIGRGGMGAVYLARRCDRQFDKKVAIKLIKRGMDTDAIVRRFCTERQILAHLDHPNIARLLDGGTTETGLPFFIMEHVEGVPITRYADEHGLATPARLQLFRQVCAAVHFAHQRLVIHRDLKPSNILVTADGEPKLLDFGVAKLLNPETDGQDANLTVSGQRPMTPAYASPEQARGEAVTTASDVYSLGALLYELLVGHAPYRFADAAPHEVARIICGQEPTLPSVAADRRENARIFFPWLSWPGRRVGSGSVRETRRWLCGDLDNIVLMAMRKEPGRRYASAAQLSADLGSYLDGRPVRARKDTWAYRTRKFVARNKTATAAAVFVVLALLAGTSGVAWQAHIANRERARAEHRFNDVRRLANSFLFELNDEIEKGPTKARKLLVERAKEYLDSLAAEARGDVTLERELAAAYQKLGDVQSRLNQANIGDTAGALESYRKARTLQRALLYDDRATPTGGGILRRELASSEQRLGDMLSKTGHTAAALEAYRAALPLLEGAARTRDPGASLALASGHVCVGRALVRTGKLAAAAEQYRRAGVVIGALPPQADPSGARHREQTRLDQSLGFLASLLGRWPEALADYHRNLAVWQARADADPADVTTRRFLMDSVEWVAIALRECGDPAGALAAHRRALTLCQELLTADPTNVQTHNDLADVLHEIGNTLLVQNDAAGALTHYQQARDHYRIVAAADLVNVHVQRQEATVQEEMADAQEQQGALADALTLRRADLTTFERLAAADADNVEFLHDHVLCLMHLGELRIRTGDAATGEDDLRRAQSILERLVMASPLNARVRADLAKIDLAMGRECLRPGSSEAAQQEGKKWCWRSLELWRNLRDSNALNFADAAQPGAAMAALETIK